MLAHPGVPIPPEELTQVADRLTNAEIHTLDADFAEAAGDLIKQTRIDGDSLGAVVEVVAVNVPALVGDPLYQSLKLRLMGALGGLHAAQSCEIGAGRDVVSRRGSENNDPIRGAGYQANSHGGLIGGVTTGMPLVCRVGFKPTSTIVKPQQSVRKNLEEIDFLLKKGRHDPCVGVRGGSRSSRAWQLNCSTPSSCTSRSASTRSSSPYFTRQPPLNPSHRRVRIV